MKHRTWNRLLGGTYLALAIGFLLVPIAQAQTYQVLYNFTGAADGANPTAGVTIDGAGNLYGTANTGGTDGSGSVYQLKHKNSGWLLNPLYSFTGGSDGGRPEARVIFGPDGALYGTTYAGGFGGTVFKLAPSPTACKTALCPWTETVLHSFTGHPHDGDGPVEGDLFLDRAGNIYGTTFYGGAGNCNYGHGVVGCGAVYELAVSGSGYTESVLYSFTGGNDGARPIAGVTMDNAGNLYGTTGGGGDMKCSFGCGVVFQLSPSQSGWTENVIYTFQGGNDGGEPKAGLIFDQSGSLYGATSLAGANNNGGTVFELSPNPDGSWTYSVLYSLPGNGSQSPSCGVFDNLAMDGAGNLYGTTYCDGKYGYGNVFKLTKTGGGYTSLYDFTGGGDGGNPVSNVIFDKAGNLFGTTSRGGTNGKGVVWQITP